MQGHANARLRRMNNVETWSSHQVWGHISQYIPWCNSTPVSLNNICKGLPMFNYWTEMFYLLLIWLELSMFPHNFFNKAFLLENYDKPIELEACLLLTSSKEGKIWYATIQKRTDMNVWEFIRDSNSSTTAPRSMFVSCILVPLIKVWSILRDEFQHE